MGKAPQPVPEYRKTGHAAELYSRIEIHASPERIWEILTNFAEYPDWNPFIRSIRGDVVEKTRLAVYLKPSGAVGMTIKPVLLKVNPLCELRWKGKLLFPGLFDGEHVFEIMPREDGTCLFIQHEYFSGILLPLLENMLKRDTARGFAEMNEALKARAEKTVMS
jgi:hypothetical protein